MKYLFKSFHGIEHGRIQCLKCLAFHGIEHGRSKCVICLVFFCNYQLIDFYIQGKRELNDSYREVFLLNISRLSIHTSAKKD